MVCKRLFHDEESYEISSKHRRQQDHTAQLSPVLEIDPWNHGSQKSASDGEGENSFSESQDEGGISKDVVNEFLNGSNMESQVGASSNISSYLWVNGNVSGEFTESERALHLSFFPHYFELDRVKALVRPDDIFATLLDPLRRPVSVGPEYQADVPEWVPHSFKNSADYLDKSDARVVFAQSSDSWLMVDDNGGKLGGICVIPMPDLESPAFNCCLGDGSESNCNCLDEGSIRCARQHVLEARDKLRENLGQEKFEELGFCDMGEEVAKKWSEEEEQAFHEVVLSNPASLGKNFWERLSNFFPSRTKRDLVSYYFNVFMLWKRAEQNRFDPLNIDSDNDEWQRSELGITEEGDDSAVEFLANHDARIYNQENDEENFLEGIENGDETGTCKDNANLVYSRNVIDEENEGDIDDVSEADIQNLIGHCGPEPVFQLSSKISDNNREDIQDDSCALYEYQTDARVPCQE